jgi:hypothetical protein
MIMENVVSYNQKGIQKKLAQYINSNESTIQFSTEFGSVKCSTTTNFHNSEWDKVKDHLFNEYDDLWRELAKS